jgi:hypothetical protein
MEQSHVEELDRRQSLRYCVLLDGRNAERTGDAYG